MQEPAGEVIHRICQGALHLMHGNRDLMKVLLMEALGEDPIAIEEYRMLFERWSRAQARILRTLIQRGEVREIDVDEVSRDLVLITVGAFGHFLMSSPGRADGESVPEELALRVEHITKNLLTSILT